jgi:transcriptional regulator with XRE-family HTH domain
MPGSDDQRFGTRLRSLRRGAALSLRALAEVSNYSRSYLWDLEAGHKHPSPTTARRLDAALSAGGTLIALAERTPRPTGGPHRSARTSGMRRTTGQRADRVVVSADNRRGQRSAEDVREGAAPTESTPARTTSAAPTRTARRDGTVPIEAAPAGTTSAASGCAGALPDMSTSSDATPTAPGTARPNPPSTRRRAMRPSDAPAGTGCRPIDDAVSHWRTLADTHRSTTPPADPAAARIHGRSISAWRWSLLADPPPQSERFDATRYASAAGHPDHPTRTTPTTWPATASAR